MYDDLRIDPELDFLEIGCDGCDMLMGVMTAAEWEEASKELILCGRCHGHELECCTPSTLRRVGKLVEAAAIERQWAIEHGDICNNGRSDLEEAELSDIPF